MIHTEVIWNNNETIKLSCLIIDNKKVMPDIGFILSPNDKYNIYWDNPNYVFGEFKQYLKDFISRTRTPQQLVDFDQIKGFIKSTEDAEEVLAMLKLAEDSYWEINIPQLNK